MNLEAPPEFENSKEHMKEEDEELYRRVNSDMGKDSFMKLLQGKRDSLGLRDIDLKSLQFDKDPWDTTLVPEEPDPSFYDTYEGERVWAFLRVTNLIFLCSFRV